MDLVEAIDFDVLVLLAGIMVVNFVVVHQMETKRAISWIQNMIQSNPRKGFWITSLFVFLSAPFLTNDGVCLLFVEPIMDAFTGVQADPTQFQQTDTKTLDLRKSDAFYFLIVLACSSNIGSALTYTGNPQNILIADDAIGVLPPAIFLLHMLLPTLFTWIVTTMWVERCWLRFREGSEYKWRELAGIECDLGSMQNSERKRSGSADNDMPGDGFLLKTKNSDTMNDTSTGCRNHAVLPITSLSTVSDRSPRRRDSAESPFRSQRSFSDGDLPQLLRENHPLPASVMSKIIYIVASPFPYAICLLLSVMVALIFANIISISGLIVCAAVIMVCFTVLGNHWQGKAIWGADGNQGLLSSEEKKKNTNEFFERLFASLDYSLLILFAGLFVVLENISSTGIPSYVWTRIVGETPFKNASSVIGICFFVLISSQFLGNVPVIQLAKPNVEYLDDDDKRYAWCILSFVATIGGNLTITGSAANIIVAEKANRLDPSNAIEFFSHYKVCFWVTLMSCIVGVMFISGTTALQNSTTEF